jgi:hypothetical protein
MQALTRSSVKKTPALSSRKEQNPTSRHQRTQSNARNHRGSGPDYYYREFIAREIIPSQYMEGDRAEESRGQKGKSYRHSGTFSKGLRRIPFPRSLAFCSGPERPGAAATDPKTPDAVARRTVSPPSADRSTASRSYYLCRISLPVRALGLGRRWQRRRSRRPCRRQGGSACLHRLCFARFRGDGESPSKSQRETHAPRPPNSTSNGHTDGRTPTPLACGDRLMRPGLSARECGSVSHQ